MYVTIELKNILRWAAVFLCILIPGLLYLSLPSPATPEPVEALETASWGLSFPNPGQAPDPGVSGEMLAANDAKFMGDPGEKIIYLTFDCGYEAGYTEKILDVLKAHNAPGTFFVVGNYIRDNGDLVRRMAAEGHTVGNHTWSHPDLSCADGETIQKELSQVETAYKDCVGEELPRYMRPPRGKYSESCLAAAKAAGYKTVFWSLAYVDWYENDQPDPAEAISLLNRRIHNGAVVLLHNTSKTNGEILDALLTGWEQQGYRFGSMETLFAD